MTDADTVPACPECKTSGFERRTSPDAGGKYRCRACGLYFDQPTRRPPRWGGGGVRGGLAQRLLDADPDEVRAND